MLLKSCESLMCEAFKAVVKITNIIMSAAVET